MSRYSSKPKHGAQRNKLGKPFKPKHRDMTKLHESKMLDEKLKTAHKKAEYDEKMKMARVMREYKAGKLRDSYGRKVTSREQAVAIAISEGNKAQGKTIEAAEHPSLSAKQAGSVAKDHLKEDKNYYDRAPQHVEREGHDYPIGGKPGDKFNDEGSKAQEKLFRSTPPSVRKAIDKQQAKTKIEYTVQGNYGGGWEDLTSEDKAGEIHDRLNEYNENEPEYRHRIVKRRVPNKAPHHEDREGHDAPMKYPAAKNQKEIQSQYFQGRDKGKVASTSIEGDKIYSYGTVIGVKKGNTFYLNENKYSVTTSKMQGKLASEATRQGYTVERVKPEQPGGRTDNKWADKL